MQLSKADLKTNGLNLFSFQVDYFKPNYALDNVIYSQNLR